MSAEYQNGMTNQNTITPKTPNKKKRAGFILKIKKIPIQKFESELAFVFSYAHEITWNFFFLVSSAEALH